MYVASINSGNRNKVDVFDAISGAYVCFFYANTQNGHITNVQVQGDYISLIHSDGRIDVYNARNKSYVRSFHN